MKRLLFFLMAIVFAIQGWTQTVPITIGTGTTTSSLSALPGLYGYNISANLYHSSEIGVSAGGDIESLEYNISSITAGTSARRLKIYLVEVTDDTLDLNQSWTALTSTATLVYDSTSFYAPTSGWKEFVFTSPFSYSGSGNLLILTEGYGCSASGSCQMTIYNSAGTASICFNRYKDTSPLSFTTNLALLTEGSGNTDKRPNIILNISPSGDYCYPPTQLAVDNITSNSADFTWTTHSTGSSWTVQYKPASDDTWSTEDVVYIGSYSLPNLTPNTLYDFRVKSYCATSESAVSTISFRTACDNIYNLPFENSFDEYGTGSGTFPSCWTKITSNTYPYISTTNSSSPGSMYLYTASGA
ncbi:MAG: fibronectin type III domain-containing protein, partial [Bacteroidales bacterium]|nr:fibronectin type III domain-containing protein [Bacteroidales bacterium]